MDEIYPNQLIMCWTHLMTESMLQNLIVKKKNEKQNFQENRINITNQIHEIQI